MYAAKAIALGLKANSAPRVPQEIRDPRRSHPMAGVF